MEWLKSPLPVTAAMLTAKRPLKKNAQQAARKSAARKRWSAQLAVKKSAAKGKALKNRVFRISVAKSSGLADRIVNVF